MNNWGVVGMGLLMTACGSFQFRASTSGGEPAPAAPEPVETAASASAEEGASTPEEDPVAAIGRLAVIDRLEGFTEDDAFDLEKVEAAWLSASPDMFVQVADVKGSGSHGLHTYQPTPKHELPRSSHASKDAYSVEWKHGKPVLTRRLSYPDLPVGTPVLVWSRRGELGYVVVTADGGRYRVSARARRPDKKGYEPSFVRGLGDPARWPEEVQDTVLFLPDLEHLQGRGGVPADTVERFREAQNEAKACAERVWASAEPVFRSIELANVTRSTRQARLEQAKARLTKQKNQQCAPHVEEARRVVQAAIDAHAERRRGVGARVRARLEKLAAASR